MKSSKVQKNCLVCKSSFMVHRYRAVVAKFCSFKCYHKDMSINLRPSAFKKGHGQIGTDNSERIRRKKISIAFTKEKHPLWKGDSKNLTYIGLHRRIRVEYGRPKKCEHCGKKGKIRESDKRWNIDWANKSGKYKTDNISDWMGLCRSCHVKYDNKNRKK